MPLPLVLAPFLPIALRVGAVAVVGYAAKRALAARTHAGRTDQRAEDALDDLNEGLGLHAPMDATGQRNAALRVCRTFQFRGRTWQLDAGAIARWRFRECE
jgi:hypothetical protein